MIDLLTMMKTQLSRNLASICARGDSRYFSFPKIFTNPYFEIVFCIAKIALVLLAICGLQQSYVFGSRDNLGVTEQIEKIVVARVTINSQFNLQHLNYPLIQN